LAARHVAALWICSRRVVPSRAAQFSGAADEKRTSDQFATGAVVFWPAAFSDASEIWRRECESINQEMERLILSDWPRSREENQVRKIRLWR
jgi:hypothetical protein